MAKKIERFLISSITYRKAILCNHSTRDPRQCIYDRYKSWHRDLKCLCHCHNAPIKIDENGEEYVDVNDLEDSL